ncbi:hypothetical protein GCM10023189_58490 [Nibrella saemangeumensis]|uniref:Uncharacterized protein n=1 Tax=Nibrella saemangeumensis TaxID=1084526 RepID=A0ABP8NS82_9BACT
MKRTCTRLVAAAIWLLSASSVIAQPSVTDLREFSRQRYQHQKALSLTLGGYAVANMAVSGIAATQTTGETKYFHRMNTYWNAVNAGIAGIGLLGLRNRPENESLGQAVRQHENIKQFLLLNAGLDVAYIAGGLWLMERGNNRPDQRDKLRGFGKAVLVNGGFLLAFDVVNYFIFKGRDKRQQQLLEISPIGGRIVLPIK